MPYLLHDQVSSYQPQQLEQLLSLQANAASTADLFSLITGIKPNTASQCLTQLAAGQRNSLEVLRHITQLELLRFLTKKQTSRVLAAIELGKRLYGSQPTPKTIDSPDDAAAALSYDLAFQTKERFAVLVLNTKNRLIATEIISIGTATETPACPKEIFAAVLKAGGTRCIVAHNHPSGSIEPSPQDVDLTCLLLRLGQLMKLPILDHLILAQGQFCSLHQTTTLWQQFPQPD